MPKTLPGITSVIVYTSKDAAAVEKSGGVIANVDLCFGAGHVDSIRFIRIRKMTGPTPGVTAHVPKTAVLVDGVVQYKPVLTGQVEKEARYEALVAFDKVKQAFGIKFNKAYVVNAREVKEICLP